jgi:hypothetical protein
MKKLNEWVDANGNKVSLNKTSPKTNKEKFIELIAYMKKYEVPYSEAISFAEDFKLYENMWD